MTMTTIGTADGSWSLLAANVTFGVSCKVLPAESRLVPESGLSFAAIALIVYLLLAACRRSIAGRCGEDARRCARSSRPRRPGRPLAAGARREGASGGCNVGAGRGLEDCVGIPVPQRPSMAVVKPACRSSPRPLIAPPQAAVPAAPAPVARPVAPKVAAPAAPAAATAEAQSGSRPEPKRHRPTQAQGRGKVTKAKAEAQGGNQAKVRNQPAAKPKAEKPAPKPARAGLGWSALKRRARARRMI